MRLQSADNVDLTRDLVDFIGSSPPPGDIEPDGNSGASDQRPTFATV